MDFGNNYVGCTMSEGYTSLHMFPLGMEVIYFNYEIELRLTVFLMNFSILFGKNRTLFYD